MDNDTKEKILNSNLEVHRVEAPLYDAIHSEIFNLIEQKRLTDALHDAAARIPDSNHRALDIGCGTGNITLKLLDLGLTVDALDLSPEMIEVLRAKTQDAIRTGRLHLHCGALETLPLSGGYGLITSFSVLHHLPDYLQTVSAALDLLAPGGILFIDHEHVAHAEESAALQTAEKILHAIHEVARLPYLVYRKVTKLFFPAIFRRLRPNIDYTLSDYWVHGGRTLDIAAIERIAAAKNCTFSRTTYLNYSGGWIAAVLYPLFSSSAFDTQRLVIQKTR